MNLDIVERSDLEPVLGRLAIVEDALSIVSMGATAREVWWFLLVNNAKENRYTSRRDPVSVFEWIEMRNTPITVGSTIAADLSAAKYASQDDHFQRTVKRFAEETGWPQLTIDLDEWIMDQESDAELGATDAMSRAIRRQQFVAEWIACRFNEDRLKEHWS